MGSQPFPHRQARFSRSSLRIEAVLLVLLLIGTQANAKTPSTQYVNIAPLPGAGIATNAHGELDGYGAIQLNIPIAYTPGANFSSLCLFTGNHIGKFSAKPSNGTGVFGAGFGRSPRIYFSAMQVSSLIFRESKALNVQVQLTEESPARPAIALGSQDLLNKEESTGEAKSFYAVVTKCWQIAGKRLYLTLGHGSGRFLHRPFGGISTPLSEHLSALLEYDGFQLNEALAWRPAGRFSPLTITLGYNNRSGPVVGTSLSGRLPTTAQLAIGAALIGIREN